MKPLLPLLLANLVLFSAPASITGAQEAQATQAALPEARTVIDRYVEVTHAKAVLERTSSMHIKGELSVPAVGVKGSVEMWCGKPNRRHFTLDMGAFGKSLVGFDGKVAWTLQPMVGAQLLKDTDLLQAKVEAAYDGVLKKSDAYESLKTVGRESFEDRDCYKVEVVMKPLEGMDAETTRKARTSFEFYEVESGLRAGTKSTMQGEIASGSSTEIVSDYKDFGGQLLPTKTTVRQGPTEIVLTFTSVDYDTATDASFTPPKEVLALLSPAPETPAKPQ